MRRSNSNRSAAAEPARRPRSEAALLRMSPAVVGAATSAPSDATVRPPMRNAASPHVGGCLRPLAPPVLLEQLADRVDESHLARPGHAGDEDATRGQRASWQRHAPARPARRAPWPAVALRDGNRAAAARSSRPRPGWPCWIHRTNCHGLFVTSSVIIIFIILSVLIIILFVIFSDTLSSSPPVLLPPPAPVVEKSAEEKKAEEEAKLQEEKRRGDEEKKGKAQSSTLAAMGDEFQCCIWYSFLFCFLFARFSSHPSARTLRLAGFSLVLSLVVFV